MKAWSNIEISAKDTEIIKINGLEKKLGDLSDEVYRIRELITRFEVCHFKYRQHLKIIKDSIKELKPKVNTSKIGLNHIQHGENVLNKDTTGKSLIGQQYVWAIKDWLNNDQSIEFPEKYDKLQALKIHKWLGGQNHDKIRLVRLLLARLIWDWDVYNKLLKGGQFEDIEFQASRMDICHYAFPKNLDLVIQGIGRMKAITKNKFEGCGSYNIEIKVYLENEFLTINNELRSLKSQKPLDREHLIKAWLTACLAKTIKENINISVPIEGIDICK